MLVRTGGSGTLGPRRTKIVCRLEVSMSAVLGFLTPTMFRVKCHPWIVRLPFGSTPVWKADAGTARARIPTTFRQNATRVKSFVTVALLPFLLRPHLRRGPIQTPDVSATRLLRSAMKGPDRLSTTSHKRMAGHEHFFPHPLALRGRSELEGARSVPARSRRRRSQRRASNNNRKIMVVRLASRVKTADGNGTAEDSIYVPPRRALARIRRGCRSEAIDEEAWWSGPIASMPAHASPLDLPV